MFLSKSRLYLAGLIAFLIGLPLTEKAFGSLGGVVGYIIDTSIYASDGES